MEEDTSGDSSSVVEVEFTLGNSAYPFVAATENGDCVIELAEMVPREGEQYAEFFNITGTEPERILEITAPFGSLEVSLLREFEDGGLFEFIASGECPAFTLAELGALPREAISLDGEARIIAEIPPQYDASVIIDTFLKENPEAELVSKQEQDSVSPFFTQSALQQLLHSRLTERQREVLQAAYDAGYYEWPREASGTDVAAELDISSATFSEHIHAAERNLLTVLLDRSEGN